MNVVSNDRPALCRSEFQPNLLEYIDTTLSESFVIHRTVTNDERDQFSNTQLDQYLLYLLCQKIEPSRAEFYHHLHQLILDQGHISKGFFEYSPPSHGHQRSIYQQNFRSYTNFIWNEFSVNVLLELGCVLLKYRLRDLFLPSTNPHGFFLELLIIYYLFSQQSESFRHSRSIEMIFPSPALNLSVSRDPPKTFDDIHSTFERFLVALQESGEIHFNREMVLSLLHQDALQFLQRKLSSTKRDFLSFLETHRLLHRYSRSLKSLCRQIIKMHVQHYPDDIEQFSCSALLRSYLLYEESF